MSDSDAVQFRLIPVREWYEKHEMLEDARIYGYPMTESLFDDWIEGNLRCYWNSYGVDSRESCVSASSAHFRYGDGSTGENSETLHCHK